MMKVLFRAAALIGVAAFPFSANAQWISLGLRGTGGVPTGAFAEDESSSSSALTMAARTGFGYGLEAAAGIGPLAAYAGFDRISFDCKPTTCFDEGNYTLSGVDLGLLLFGHGLGPLRPFARGGVTFNHVRGSYGSSSNGLTSDRAPGFEVAAGIDIKLAGLVGLAPQVRYVGQNLKVKVPGITSPDPDGQGVNYFTFDLGLTFHTPYSLFGR